MTSEGGGKLRQKRSHISKPYDRPKSLLNRVTDAVRSILSPSWVIGLTSSQSIADDDGTLNNNNVDDGGAASLRSARSALNTLPGPSGVTFPRALQACERRPQQATTKSKIALDGERASFWNPLWSPPGDSSVGDVSELSGPAASPSTQSSSFFSGLKFAEPLAARPSTSTPCVLSGGEDGPANGSSKDYALPAPRRNGSEREPSSRAASATTPASALPRKRFAKLSDIGKLTRDAPAARRKGEQENGANLAGDSQSECSEESVSTSGCSSMIPHPDKREYQRDVLQLNKPALQKLSEELQTSVPVQSRDRQTTWNRTKDLTDQSTSKMPSFLWSETRVTSLEKSVMRQPTAASSKPQFKPYLMGSPVWNDKSLLNFNSTNMSPTGGKVAYGFGSTFRQARLKSTAPYSTTSSRKQIQVKMASSGNLDIMSTTAKRILETLEKMSTPVLDAKRIPTIKPDSVLDSPLTFMHSTYKRWPSLAKKTTFQINKVEASCNPLSSRGPPVSKLMTPGSVAVTKTYLRNPALPTTAPSVYEKTTDTYDSSMENRIPHVNHFERRSAGKAGGKVKTAKSSLHYSKKASEEEHVEMPDLPSVPLLIKSLPVFDIVSPASKSAPGSSSTLKGRGANPRTYPVSNASTLTTTSPVRHRERLNRNRNDAVEMDTNSLSSFQFSSPIVKQAIDTALDNIKKQFSDESPQFKFSSPIAVDVKSTPQSPPEHAAPLTTSKSTNFVFKPPPAVSPVKSKAMIAKPATSIIVAAELKTGSVLEFLSKASSRSATALVSEKKSAAVGEESSASKTSVTSSVSTGFCDKFRPAAGSWECSTCMLHNKAGSERCLACETPKSAAMKDPKASSSESTAPSSASSNVSTPAAAGFGDMFKPAADTWECPSCMLRVKRDLQKCAACETPKPGLATDSKPSSGADATGEKVTSATAAAKPAPASSSSGFQDTFKLATGMWECETCLVRNSSSVAKCIACESPKPGATVLPVTTSSFKFGFTTQPSATTSAALSVFAQPSFAMPTTGTPSSTVSSGVVPTFKFGIPPSLPTAEKTLPVTSAATAVVAAPTTTSASPAMGFGATQGEEATAFKAPPQFKFGAMPSTIKSDSTGFKITSAAMPESNSPAPTGFKILLSSPANDSSPAPPAYQPPKGETGAQANVEFSPNVNATIVPVSLSSSATAVVPTWTSANFKFGAGNQSMDNSAAPLAAEKIDNPLFSKTTAPTMTTVSTAPATFSFSSGKPEITNGNFAFGALPTPAASTTVATSAVTQIPPNAGFSFKFGGDASSTTASSTPAPNQPTFTFGAAASAAGETKVGSLVPSAAQPPGGFQFSFGAAPTTVAKRKANNDDEIIAKKPTLAANGGNVPSFGNFSSANASPGFTFGSAPSASVAAGPATGSVFGALSSGGDKPVASNNFTFGATAASTNSSTGLPTFGSTGNQSLTSVFSSKAVSASPFGAAVSKTAAFGAAVNTPTFTFGLQSPASGVASNTASAIPSFGNAAATPAAPAFGVNQAAPVFGSSSTPAFGGFNTASANPTSAAPAQPLPSQGFNAGFSFNPPPTFQFGNQPRPDTGVFTFSANQNNQQSQAVNPGFSFGQMQPTTQQPATQSSGFNFNPAPQMNMNFLPNPTEFSAANPFDAQGAANRPGRQIRRAKRRTHK